ncbi:MAG TPA: nitrate reductase cytochrome c-type subunit [Thiobacillaceae bacterium]|nr:nitrate reductase cytochrome c-type subunit [Thiobacillaceae bacterium]
MVKRVVCGSVLMAWFLSLPALAVQDAAIPDEDLGLSKTSVFDVPSPDVVEYKGADPGANVNLPRSYHTAPPMIPHSIQGMVPITQEANLCRDCHVNPDLIGQKIDKGVPNPAPVSHYVDVKAGQLYMGRFNCTQCHAPQANVKLLVDSVFIPKKKVRRR